MGEDGHACEAAQHHALAAHHFHGVVRRLLLSERRSKMVKFKIAFTIDAKTLFAYLSQALPTLENLHVEEIIEKPQTIEKKFLSSAPVKVSNEPIKQKHKSSKKRQFKLDSGINQIIVSILSDGQAHHSSEIEKALSTTMYSSASSSSRLAALKNYGVIHQPDIGKWQLTEKYLHN
jgi:hypothetical protein